MIASSTVNFISQWQTLVGSFLGAFIPIVVAGVAYLIRRVFAKREERKLAVRVYIQDINFAITEVLSMRTNLDLFVSRLNSILSAQWPTDKHFLARTNYPNIVPNPLDKSFLRVATTLRSAYLITRAQDLYSKTGEGWSFFGSLKEDFYRGLDLHQSLIVTEHIPKGDANLIHRDNLEAIRRVMSGNVLGENIPTLLKILVKTRMAASRYAKHPYWWRWVNEKGRMKFFINRSGHREYQQSYYDRVESSIEAAANAEFDEIEKAYKEDLARQLSAQQPKVTN